MESTRIQNYAPAQGDLRAGDIYRVVRPFSTLASRHYRKGDLLELVEPTQEAPFGFSTKDGINWIVRCKYFGPPLKQSIWSSISYLIGNGSLELVRDKQPGERRLYIVQAQVVTEEDGWRSSIGVPTFFLDIDVLGIVDDDHAEGIARRVLDPLGVAKEIHISLAKV